MNAFHIQMAAGRIPVTPAMDESNQTSSGGVPWSEGAESAWGGVRRSPVLDPHRNRTTAADDAVSLRDRSPQKVVRAARHRGPRLAIKNNRATAAAAIHQCRPDQKH